MPKTILVLVMLSSLTLLSYPKEKTRTPVRPGWELTWSDEFNSGSVPDPAKWQPIWRKRSPHTRG